MTGTCLPAILLTRCSLPARPLGPDRQLPACDRRGSTSSLRSGPVESKRYITKALRGTTGNARSPMSNQSSPMLMLTSTGGSPVHTTPRSRDLLPLPADPSRSRDPLYHTVQYTERDHQAWQSYASPDTVYTSPWASYGHQSARPAPAWYQPVQPSPRHHWGTRQQWDYASSRPNCHGSSLRGASTSLPPAGNPPTVRIPSASDSSAAEADSRDRSPRRRSKSKRRGREASASSGKRRKTSFYDRHHLATPLSSSSDSKEAESQSTPPPEEASDSAARPQGAPDSHRDNQNAPVASAVPQTSTEATPSTSGRPPCSWTSSLRDHEGERSESLYSVDIERDDSFASVLDLIRRFHSIEKPAGVTPSRGRTTVARTLSLQTEPSPALHLPPSDLLRPSSTM